MQDLLIVWTEINDNGIAIVDQQHRGIVSVINSLFFFMRHQQGEEILVPAISMIEQYAKIHFLTEERLMEAAKYPDFDAHKKLHDNLVSRSIAVGYECKKNHDPYGYLLFLKDWWVNHINVHDMDYVDYLLNSPVISKEWKKDSDLDSLDA